MARDTYGMKGAPVDPNLNLWPVSNSDHLGPETKETRPSPCDD